MDQDTKTKFDLYMLILDEANKMIELGKESNDPTSIYIGRRTIEMYEPLRDALLQKQDQ